LQPTYVSLVLFFWQIYISSVAARPRALAVKDDDEAMKTLSLSQVEELKMQMLFDEIDKDKVSPFFLKWY
jgi:hypothetical protein